MSAALPSEWPWTAPAARVGEAPLRLVAEADAAVRAALTQRFGIVGIEALAAEVTLRLLTDGDIGAVARLRARLIQSCVVSLEPVAETIDVSIEGCFSERPPEPHPGEEVVAIDPDDDSDEPEPVVDGLLQLGEWLAQQLSLAMDPYPRAAGAAIDASLTPDEAEAPPTHRPFAGLARLRGDDEDG